MNKVGALDARGTAGIKASTHQTRLVALESETAAAALDLMALRTSVKIVVARSTHMGRRVGVVQPTNRRHRLKKKGRTASDRTSTQQKSSRACFKCGLNGHTLAVGGSLSRGVVAAACVRVFLCRIKGLAWCLHVVCAVAGAGVGAGARCVGLVGLVPPVVMLAAMPSATYFDPACNYSHR